MRKMRFQAVLFDLDGTLLDTIEGIATAMNRVMDRLGCRGHGTETYKRFVGEGMEKLVARSLPAESPLRLDLARIVTMYREEYRICWEESSKPYPGIPEMLAGLAGRGIQLAVLSNKADDFTRIMTSRLLPGIHFARVRGALPGEPKKPDPRMAIETAEALAVPAPNFIYVGDSATDMHTAQAAGMFPVGVAWGFRTADELRQSGAKILLEKPSDIFNLF